MIVTAAAIEPLVGDTERINGVTVKLIPEDALPLTVTTTFPVVAAVGTAQTILVLDHDEHVADVPLNVTVELPWLDPNPVPVRVTDVATGPLDTDRLTRFGVTVNVTELLTPFVVVTTTPPVVAPDGTVTPMAVADQEVTVSAAPFRVAVLLPWEDPKFVPLIVKLDPIFPEVADRLEIAGGGGVDGEALTACSIETYTPDAASVTLGVCAEAVALTL